MLDKPIDPALAETEAPDSARPSIEEMPADDYKPNDLVFIDDRPFRFLKKPKGRLPHDFYDEENAKVAHFWTSELFDLMGQGRYYRPGRGTASGEPEFPDSQAGKKREAERKERLSRTFLAFQHEPRAKADAKYRYVAHFLNKQKLAPEGQPFHCNKANAALVIEEVDKEIDELNEAQPKPQKWIRKPKRRSPSALLDWMHREREMQIGKAALIHRNAVKRRKRKFPDVVYEKIAEAIRELVQVSHKLGPTKILIAANSKIEDHELKSKTTIPRPTLSVVQSEYRRFDAWVRMAQESGVEKADLEYGAVGKLERPSWILDMLELDNHKFDLHGIFGKTPLGKAISTTGLDRFWVCLSLDLHSGYPVGFAITFEPGGLLPALMCIDHSMRLKTYVKARWPHIDGELLGFGKPVRFRYDNAKEFISIQMKHALARVGVGFQLAIPGKPQTKPYVERGFGTIEEDFVHWLKGTTYSNVQQKGKRDPLSEAKIPWEDFQMLFHQYLIECYARRPQEGLDWDTPEERWMRGMVSPSHRPRSLTKYEQERWDIVASIEVPVKVYREGFVWNRLWYQSEELQHIRRHSGFHGKRKRGPTPLMARIPLLDVSKAYVSNPHARPKKDGEAEKEIVVLCTNPYVVGRTAWQHEVVRKYLLHKKNRRGWALDPENHRDYGRAFLRLFKNALDIMGVSLVGDPPKKGRLSGGAAPRFVGALLGGPTQHALKQVEETIERYDLLGEMAAAIKASSPPEKEGRAPAPSGAKKKAAERGWKAHDIELSDPLIEVAEGEEEV